MYTKPLVFKIISIINLALSVLGFIAILVVSLKVSSELNTFIYTAFGISIETISTVFIVMIIIAGLAGLFLSYLEFTFMFQVANMIQHVNKDDNVPMKKCPFTFTGKFYSIFGTVIFTIEFICTLILVIYSIATQSCVAHIAIVVPLGSILISLIPCVIIYFMYYSRYKSFGDLLSVMVSENPSQNDLENLKDDKTGALHGFCWFIFIMSILMVIGTIVALIIIAPPVEIFITLLICAIIEIALIFMIGDCMENMLSVLEHYQIKYKLLNYNP